MKKTKVENVSDIKLDFFLKQNKAYVRVVLKPGESSWCDSGTTSKSMILYERKNLIKSSDTTQEFLPAPGVEEIENSALSNAKNIEMPEVKNVSDKTISEDLKGVQPMSGPSSELLYLEFVYGEQPSLLEKAQQETEEYKKESEKKYKGKKRGRKKKRGPKKGSKRKKGGNSSNTETAVQQ